MPNPNLQTWIALPFADGVYEFRLPLAQITELESKCDCGLGALFGRLLKGRYVIGANGESVGAPADAQWRTRDIIEIIRQGLLGGRKGIVDGQEIELKNPRINELIDNYVLGQPFEENWSLATAILSAVIMGYDPTAAQEPQPAAEAA